MAKAVIKAATLLLDSLDVSGLHNNVDPGVSVDEVECSNYAGDGFKEYLPALKGSDIALEGYLEADGIEQLQFNAIDAGTYLPFLWSLVRPLVAGSIAWFTNGFLSQWRRNQQVGTIFGYSGQLQRTAPIVRGRVTDNLDDATTGNGDGYDLTEAIGTGERLFYAIFVTQANGTGPTLDLVLESDADTGFATPTTRATLAQITAVGSVFGYVDGPVTDTAWRFVRTVGGADTPSFDFVAVIGRAPAN